ncbi:MAG TPA: sugar kinase [Victivallales bacterium]|nr:sugar kinase [Victivallales bacterium]
MKKRKYDIICVGDLCVDFIVRGNVRPQFNQVEKMIDDYSIEMGGSSGIFASGFAKLGGSIAIVGMSGVGVFDKFIKEKLLDAGVDTSLIKTDKNLKTGMTVVLTEPTDRAMLTHSGTIDAVTPDMISDKLVSSARHWHITSYFLLGKMRHFWPVLFKRLKKAGVTISIDTNWDPSNKWLGVQELLSLADIFLPNENEALALSGKSSVDSAGKALNKLCPLVVIKCGKNGAKAFFDGKILCAKPPSLRGALIDTIGAGDNFDAGFIRAWLLGYSINRCLDTGLRCGTASVSGAGGVSAQLREKLN